MSKERRPIPADFAEKSPMLSSPELVKLYRTSSNTVARWRAEMEGRMDTSAFIRPRPDDFAENAHHPQIRLTALYSCGSQSIKRWRTEVGYTPRNPAMRLPVPDGFKLVASTLTIGGLIEHYRRGRLTIRRWLKEAGVEPAAHVRPAPLKASKKRAVSNFQPQPIAIVRDLTEAGLAASFLQRRMPVSRCNAEGRFDPIGAHWRCGTVILDAEGVIARARRNGWKAEAERWAA